MNKDYSFKYNIRGNVVSFRRPQIWGILNYTSDSFYDGGKHDSIEKAIRHTDKMIQEGADVIDVGAMSSRPGAQMSDPGDDLNLLIPLLEELLNSFPDTLFSIDTVHSEVAEECIQTGAHIINDISGGNYDELMLSVVGKYDIPFVGMHMKGTPDNMSGKNTYSDLMDDILKYFKTLLIRAEENNINDIIIDPGFGFSKNIQQNLLLLKKLSILNIFDQPVMIGLSRKSTIYKTLGVTPQEALNGTTSLHMIALNNGADILRVHDVKEALECVKLYLRYMEA